MTNEELALKAKSGDQAAIAQLWEQVKNLVFRYIARSYNQRTEQFTKSGVTMDDLMQEGFLAILEAVRAFNPDKGWKFTSWIKYPLQTHLNAVVGIYGGRLKTYPLNECTSLDAPVSMEDENYTIGDSIEDESAKEMFETVEDKTFNKQLHDMLELCLSEIDSRQERAIREIFYNNKTLKEISVDMNISFQRVRQLESNGIRKLRNCPHSKQLKAFADEIITTRACRGTGFSSWYGRGSVEERIVETLEYLGIESFSCIGSSA